MKLSIVIISISISVIQLSCIGGERGKLELVNHSNIDFYYLASTRNERGPYSFHPDSITVPKLVRGKSVTLILADSLKEGMSLTLRFYAIDSTQQPIRVRQIREDKCLYKFLEENNWSPWVIDKL